MYQRPKIEHTGFRIDNKIRKSPIVFLYLVFTNQWGSSITPPNNMSFSTQKDITIKVIIMQKICMLLIKGHIR